jgi:hypothetical protein
MLAHLLALHQANGGSGPHRGGIAVGVERLGQRLHACRQFSLRRHGGVPPFKLGHLHPGELGHRLLPQALGDEP